MTNWYYKMIDLDDTDRRLLGTLRQEARASVTTLAGRLGLARTTVQARMDRLISGGVIRRFTIDTAPIGGEPVRAVMTIAVQGPMSRAVVRALRAMPELRALHSTNGAWDMVAEIETETLARFDAVLRAVREIPGVTNSEASLLLAPA
jgi:DNA-binding Lrp family transcriptional regulator